MKKIILGLLVLFSASSFAAISSEKIFDQADNIENLRDLATYTVSVSTAAGDVKEQGGSWKCPGMKNTIEIYYGISENRTAGEIFGEAFTFSKTSETVTAFESSGYDSRVLVFKKTGEELAVQVKSGKEIIGYHVCTPLSP